MNQIEIATLTQCVSHLIATLEVMKHAGITRCDENNLFAEFLDDRKFEGVQYPFPFTEDVEETLELLKKFHRNLCTPTEIVELVEGNKIKLKKYEQGQIIYVIKGEGTLTYRTRLVGDGISDEQHKMVPGVLYNIPPNSTFGIEATAELTFEQRKVFV